MTTPVDSILGPYHNAIVSIREDNCAYPQLPTDARHSFCFDVDYDYCLAGEMYPFDKVGFPVRYGSRFNDTVPTAYFRDDIFGGYDD